MFDLKDLFPSVRTCVDAAKMSLNCPLTLRSHPLPTGYRVQDANFPPSCSPSQTPTWGTLHLANLVADEHRANPVGVASTQMRSYNLASCHSLIIVP